MLISVAMLRPVVRELLARGIAPWPHFDALHVDPRILSDSGAVVSQRVYVALVERAMADAADVSLGVSAGLRGDLDSLMGVGPLLLATSSCWAFQTFDRYSRLLVDGVSLSMQDIGKNTEFRFRFHPGASVASARFGAEALAAAYRFTRQTAPQLRLQTVKFAHARPKYAERYQTVFQCSPVFGAESNCGVFDSAVLQTVSTFRDLAVEQPVRDATNQLLTQSAPQSTVVDLVRAAVRKEPNPAALDIERIAPSAFQRAFKRWTGRTPGGYMKGEG